MSRLERHQKAIDFKTSDYLGNTVQLSSYEGKKVLLSFFRGAACPFCNLRLHELINAYPELKAHGLNVMVVFNSTAAQIAEYAGKQQAPFPIIPDPSGELYRKYGVESSASGMVKAMLSPKRMWQVMTSGFFNTKAAKDRPIIPADFLIGRDQRISESHYGKHFGDHLELERITHWSKS
ncbi:MAG: AhpC/TSA family protein [Flavobacteriales bacterium]|nr:AhpC/TSA family protein [Flavobacteriales bacterium]